MSRRRGAPPPSATAGRTVLVLGPGLHDDRPDRGPDVAVLRTDDGAAVETRIPDGAGGSFVARAWIGGREDLPRLLLRDVRACVFVPDASDAFGMRNRRAFRALLEALAAAGRRPEDVKLFVTDERSVASGAYAKDPRRPVRPMLRAADFAGAARAAHALLAAPESGNATSASRAGGTGLADWLAGLLLAAAFAAAVAAAG